MAAVQHWQEDITLCMEVIGLSEDPNHNLKLNQTTFFRCVEDDNPHMLQMIFKNRKVDVNVYHDEVRRNFFIICLLRMCVCLFCFYLC